MKDKKWIWILIAVAVVVGIVASLLTANFTGNALRSYTAASTSSSSATYQGVLNILRNCIVVDMGLYGNSSGTSSTCDGICTNWNKQCISGLRVRSASYGPEYIRPITCQDNFGQVSDPLATISCVCCSPYLPTNS